MNKEYTYSSSFELHILCSFSNTNLLRLHLLHLALSTHWVFTRVPLNSDSATFSGIDSLSPSTLCARATFSGINSFESLHMFLWTVSLLLSAVYGLFELWHHVPTFIMLLWAAPLSHHIIKLLWAAPLSHHTIRLLWAAPLSYHIVRLLWAAPLSYHTIRLLWATRWFHWSVPLVHVCRITLIMMS